MEARKGNLPRRMLSPISSRVFRKSHKMLPM
jgi:hypothetical protein